MSRPAYLRAGTPTVTLRGVSRQGSWDISAQLRSILQEKNWTQKQLADACGIERTDINRMVAAEPAKRLSVGRVRAERIAQALGVTLLDLGLPPVGDEPELLTALDRLQELEETVADLIGRVLELEARPASGVAGSRKSRGRRS